MVSKNSLRGTTVKLSTFNKKFGVNYANAKDFCTKFLKPIRVNLDKFSQTSFNYSIEKDRIHIKPYAVKRIQDESISEETQEGTLIRQRLRYFMRRHQLTEQEMSNLSYHYKGVVNNRNLIESAYKEFIKNNRKKWKKSNGFCRVQEENYINKFFYLFKNKRFYFYSKYILSMDLCIKKNY